VLDYGSVGWVVWDQYGVGGLEKALLDVSKVRREVGVKGVGKSWGHRAGGCR